MSAETAFQKQIYDFLMKTQGRPVERIADYQRCQLSQLLHFVHAKVPLYKISLAPVVSNPSEIDWDHRHEVPILERPDFDLMTKLLRERTTPQMNVGYVLRKEPSLTASGKLIEYVCELPPED